MTLRDYLQLLTDKPSALFMGVLILGVIFVNGWTDAPNAIATCVSTGVLSMGKAVVLAAICNFLGALVMSAAGAQVAVTICQLVDFGGSSAQAALALSVALFSIIFWATLAWRFGIPTSESHALIAGLTGAAIALHGGFDGISSAQWMKVLWGLILSTGFGFLSGFWSGRWVKRLQLPLRFFRRAQILGAAAMSFMHGAQDGQKFMGVFLLSAALSTGSTASTFFIPFWLVLLCSAIMALGTLVGGRRIIEAIGTDMVQLQPQQGFAADIAAAGCLLLASIWGLPVSTTHTKTTAIMGVGAAGGRHGVRWQIARDMILAWILTFPVCGMLSYLSVRIFLFVA